jgi:hypothetical protein
MQFVVYGYGTGWHWCYYYSLACHTLNEIVSFYVLRYRLSVWEAFPLVKAWNLMSALSVHICFLVPISGFLSKKFLHLVPFQSPTWTLVYFYVTVRHFHCGLSDCAHMQTCGFVYLAYQKALLTFGVRVCQ